jgi:hypothetical protein
MPWYNPRTETIWVILNAESQVKIPSRRHVSVRTGTLKNMERTQTSIDRDLLDAVRELAAEEGRDETEVIEEAVSRYLAAFAGHVPEHVLERLVSDREVSEERRAAARKRLFEVAGSGGLDDEEAQALAEEAVRRARAETERRAEAAAPSPEEVRARREARIRGSS